MSTKPLDDAAQIAPCRHTFVYGGVTYEVQDYPLPGTGAKAVYYFDWFYCAACLTNRYHRLAVVTNTCEPIRFDATPKED